MKKRLLYLILLLPFLGFSQIFTENWDGDGPGIDAWTVIDNDGLPVAAGVDFITDAWTVVDRMGAQNLGGPAGNFAAASTSFYDPAGAADDYLISPSINLATATSATLIWDSKAQDPLYRDGYELRLSPTGGNTVADFTVLLFSVDEDNSVWTTRTASLAPYLGTSVRIAFINKSEDMYLILVDNISVVSCAAPIGGMLVSATTTTATVSWMGSATSFDIEYGPLGFVQGSGTTINSLTNEATITGLVNATQYQYYIKSNCGESSSSFAGPFTFFTTCDSTDTPYSENFESAIVPGLPNCTTGSNVGGNPWATSTATEYGFTGTKLRYRWNTAEAANAWFYTRGVNLTAGQSYTINYDYGGSGTTFPEALKVSYGTTASAAGMTTELANYPVVTNATPLTASLTLIPTTTGVYYFGFNAYSEADQFYLFVDNIFVEETPACGGITGLVATPTDNSAVITWNAVASAIGYEYVVDQIATDPISGTVTTAVTYTATSLLPATQYYFHIRSACADNAFGGWRTIAFTTNPAPPVNDNCENAIVLTAGGNFDANAINTTSTSATVNSNDPAPTCSFVNAGKDVWYSVVVPDSGSITVETKTSGTSLDTVLEIYSGTCGALIPIQCNDDNPGSGAYSLTSGASLTPGSIVYIRAWGYGTSSGAFSISAYDASLLGIDSFANGNFTYYPNPVKSVLNLSFVRNITDVAVFNLIGQQVLVKSVNATQSEIDMTALASGTYVLKVTADGQVKTLKVIKE